MFHLLKIVRPLDHFHLRVSFYDGSVKEYDVSELGQRWPVFESLCSNPDLFQRVEVSPGGFGIFWNDDLDLSCDELYENGQDVSPADKVELFRD